MSTGWRQIPAGLRDSLPDQCHQKRQIEATIRNALYSWSYNEVETPAFEYYDMFVEGKATLDQRDMFKLSETDGRIMVLRPDATIPIARMATGKLAKQPLPLKLFYITDIFRYGSSQRGLRCVDTQAGAELIGAGGPQADAEIISIVIDTLLKLGLKEFQIDMGHVGFFKGLAEEIGLNAVQAEELRKVVDQKNLLLLQSLLKESNFPKKVEGMLANLPMLFGSAQMLDKALELTANQQALMSINNLKKIYEILDDYGLSQYVTFDLGMVPSLSYYTGVVFRGITRYLGYPICTGGRYDGLMSEFGWDLEATGFAYEVEALQEVLVQQGIANETRQTDCLICYDLHKRKEAWEKAGELRERGLRVELFSLEDSSLSPEEYAKSKGIKGLFRL